MISRHMGHLKSDGACSLRTSSLGSTNACSSCVWHTALCERQATFWHAAEQYTTILHRTQRANVRASAVSDVPQCPHTTVSASSSPSPSAAPPPAPALPVPFLRCPLPPLPFAGGLLTSVASARLARSASASASAAASALFLSSARWAMISSKLMFAARSVSTSSACSARRASWRCFLFCCGGGSGGGARLRRGCPALPGRFCFAAPLVLPFL